VCFLLLALLLPQPREAHRCTQFKRFGLLLLGNLNGLKKACFGFALGGGGWGAGLGNLALGTLSFELLEYEFTFVAVNLGFVDTLPSVLDKRHGDSLFQLVQTRDYQRQCTKWKTVDEVFSLFELT